MLTPKRTKYRRPHRVSYEGKAKGRNEILNGDYALVALEGAWITNRQIEAARIAMTRAIKRQGKVWICVFPAKPLTAKPLETRMGKGKGPVDKWVMNIKPGRICFEMAGVSDEVARVALTLAVHKLPFKCKIVTKESENDLF